MPENFAILGQAAPAAATEVAVVTVPAGAGNERIVSTLQVCNTGTTSAKFRVAAVPGGAIGTAAQHYLWYDANIGPGTGVSITVGITLGPTDALRVRSDNGAVSFTAFGTAVSP